MQRDERGGVIEATPGCVKKPPSPVRHPGTSIEDKTMVKLTLREDRPATIEERRQLVERCERLEGALIQIKAWAEAYPERAFPEPDWKKARDLLEAGGISLDRVSAGCMRHIIMGVGSIARDALEDHDG